MHEYDSRGVKPSTGFLVPEGRYKLKILDFEEGFTKNGKNAGSYMVTVTFFVAEGIEVGKEIRFHRVTFLPKGAPGAGIAIHFLKTIGEPYEESENLGVDPARWVNKELYADVVIESYQRKDDEAGKPTGRRNAVKDIYPVDPSESKDDEVPF